ncbi:hypothetical protein J4227_00820 [Candidatus Woesearchaeota archaeon]|nr:hypothetical protein [Candidatus Woesearchaeota archaeon]
MRGMTFEEAVKKKDIISIRSDGSALDLELLPAMTIGDLLECEVEIFGTPVIFETKHTTERQSGSFEEVPKTSVGFNYLGFTSNGWTTYSHKWDTDRDAIPLLKAIYEVTQIGYI